MIIFLLHIDDSVFFDAKTVGTKAPTAPFLFFINKRKHIYKGLHSPKKKEGKLQVIYPVLHAFFKAGFNPMPYLSYG
jgi:hypothetical protein